MYNRSNIYEIGPKLGSRPNQVIDTKKERRFDIRSRTEKRVDLTEEGYE